MQAPCGGTCLYRYYASNLHEAQVTASLPAMLALGFALLAYIHRSDVPPDSLAAIDGDIHHRSFTLLR